MKQYKFLTLVFLICLQGCLFNKSAINHNENPNQNIKKGLYLLWPDIDYIEKSVGAGINELLIANQNDSVEADNIHHNWGEYEETKMWIKDLSLLYKNRPDINLIFLPIWNTFYMDLPVDQQFYDGEIFYTRTPCPTSIEWIDSRINFVKKMIEGTDINKVLFDPEHYGKNEIYQNEILQIWESEEKPIHICKCNRCAQQNLDNEKQWNYHNNLVKTKLGDLGYGQLNYSYAWNFKKYNEKWLYTERTYPVHDVSNKPIILFGKYTLRLMEDKARALSQGIDLKISAGIWVEKFNSDDLLKYIEFIGKNPLYEAYWIYSHTRFTKYSPIVHYSDREREKYGNLFESLIDSESLSSDPDFFIKLKKLNEEIDKYRKSWKFKLKYSLLKLTIFTTSKFM